MTESKSEFSWVEDFQKELQLIKDDQKETKEWLEAIKDTHRLLDAHVQNVVEALARYDEVLVELCKRGTDLTKANNENVKNIDEIFLNLKNLWDVVESES